MLKACGHRWQGPAAGDSSSAPLVPAPRAYRACSTKGHSEEDLKEEGSGRGERQASVLTGCPASICIYQT